MLTGVKNALSSVSSTCRGGETIVITSVVELTDDEAGMLRLQNLLLVLYTACVQNWWFVRTPLDPTSVYVCRELLADGRFVLCTKLTVGFYATRACSIVGVAPDWARFQTIKISVWIRSDTGSSPHLLAASVQERKRARVQQVPAGLLSCTPMLSLENRS